MTMNSLIFSFLGYIIFYLGLLCLHRNLNHLDLQILEENDGFIDLVYVNCQSYKT